MSTIKVSDAIQKTEAVISAYQMMLDALRAIQTEAPEIDIVWDDDSAFPGAMP